MAIAMPHVEGVEHRYAQVGDLRMHYAEAGDPVADPLLLVSTAGRRTGTPGAASSARWPSASA